MPTTSSSNGDTRNEANPTTTISTAAAIATGAGREVGVPGSTSGIGTGTGGSVGTGVTNHRREPSILLEVQHAIKSSNLLAIYNLDLNQVGLLFIIHIGCHRRFHRILYSSVGSFFFLLFCCHNLSGYIVLISYFCRSLFILCFFRSLCYV